MRALTVVAVLASAAGCDRGPDVDPVIPVIQRDSAGVRIIESSDPVWADRLPWTLVAAPLLDLTETGSGARHEFFRVSDATRLPDGSLVVLDEGSRELRVFSSKGEFRGAAGTAGEGPGEFSRMASVGQLPDGSLAVFDSWLRRITHFSQDLELIGTRSLPDQESRIVQLAWDEEGAPIGVGHSREELAAANGLYRIAGLVHNLSEPGEGAPILATLAGYEGFAFEYGDLQPLFGKSGHMAVRGTRVYLGDDDALEVRVYSTRGGLKQVMRASGLDLSLSAAEVEAERERLLAPDMPTPFREAIRDLPAPATRPAFSDLLVDSEGYVWAPEARPPGSDHGRIAQVFGPDGRWLGAIEIPPRFRALEIGSDYVLGVHRGEHGVESVQLLSLTRGGPGS